MNRQRIPILLFHRVTDLYDPYTEPLDLNQFESILKFLKNKYHIRPLDDLYTCDINDLLQSCFIVFDDALIDFYENAWPILEKSKIPVTLFVPTEPVNSKKVYWSLELFSSFILSNEDYIELSVNNKIINYNLIGNKKIQSVKNIHKLLLTTSIDERNELLDKIKNNINLSTVNSNFQMMNWDNLKTLVHKGLDVQSHTKSHEYLPMLDDDMIDDEFSLSKAEIKNQLNTLPSAVSYPYGAFNDNVIRCAGKHYKYGYITNNELLNLNQLDDYQNGRLLLSRINVTDKFPFELYFRINGFHSMIKSLFNKIIKAR